MKGFVQYINESSKRINWKGSDCEKIYRELTSKKDFSSTAHLAGGEYNKYASASDNAKVQYVNKQLKGAGGQGDVNKLIPFLFNQACTVKYGTSSDPKWLLGLDFASSEALPEDAYQKLFDCKVHGTDKRIYAARLVDNDAINDDLLVALVEDGYYPDADVMRAISRGSSEYGCKNFYKICEPDMVKLLFKRGGPGDRFDSDRKFTLTHVLAVYKGDPKDIVDELYKDKKEIDKMDFTICMCANKDKKTYEPYILDYLESTEIFSKGRTDSDYNKHRYSVLMKTKPTQKVKEAIDAQYDRVK